MLGWIGIVRLGLVQTALGAIIVLTTSTLNRVMVVELALPAMLPGFLVAIHHAVQLSRPGFGHGADIGGRSTPWIIAGMVTLATGGVGAAWSTTLMATDVTLGTVFAALSFILIGLGASASGTSLLVLLAKDVPIERKPAAATIVWFMMIAGFAVTAGVAGHYLDPFSPERLVIVSATVAVIAVLVTLAAVFRLEKPREIESINVAESKTKARFLQALRQVWQEPTARSFTVFVFLSMFAYSAQDLILEPFAGTVFGMTPGESTQLSGIQHGGVMLGMLAVALSGTVLKRSRGKAIQFWTVGGCIASAIALTSLAVGGSQPETWPLSLNVFALGVANGAFAVAAIASMMILAGHGEGRKEGLRMGLWGASQAIAFALGGFLGTVAVDVSRQFITEPALAYGLVFTAEGVLFLAAAKLGMSITTTPNSAREPSVSFGKVAMTEVM
ncbi:light harvesting pigment MFS transporter Bch2 [Luminiphilus syltensis NOR5-1B]|uniref:Light harvesting pigment MFS transporter Bch2 n=1 Tax=Luminiphilus syltensis NOR5-1B TaxID=565045 RepID=B8KT43_9GAMM|nr:BCD family MFS transporter [Luminiphilus syltensis]EED36387.1 light harvesting pigment MFS transporter Bch2 [Luminiphilus syltensis NOR5-1B]